jgi:hypothetical protein
MAAVYCDTLTLHRRTQLKAEQSMHNALTKTDEGKTLSEMRAAQVRQSFSASINAAKSAGEETTVDENALSSTHTRASLPTENV